MGAVCKRCKKPKGGAPSKKKSESRAAQIQLMRDNPCQYRFERPALAVGASGGTASIFQLLPPEFERNAQDWRQDATHEWMGKDLGHAFDELEFYSLAQDYKGWPGWQVLDHLFEYCGSLEQFPAQIGESIKEMDLIVMENAYLACVTPRLFDLKIGSRTSDANWKGKSAFASMKNSMTDALTNSVVEGLRLEGISGRPLAFIESEDPLAGLGGSKRFSKKFAKVMKRKQVQSFPVDQVLRGLADLRNQMEDGTIEHAGPTIVETSKFSMAETAELEVISTCEQLGKLWRACAKIPVPQKWIGSSVALVVDVDYRPDRPSATKFDGDWPPTKAKVAIFDWGRSEMNTPEKHAALPDGHQQDRQEFWHLYTIGIGKILWQASRLYWSRFCVLNWASVQIDVFMYNPVTIPGSTRKDKHVGRGMMHLTEKSKAISMLTLKDENGDRVMGKGEVKAEVALATEFIKYPNPSRMSGAWIINLHGAKNLPLTDYFLFSRKPSTYAVVTIIESVESAQEAGIQGTTRSTDMRTCVKDNTADPTWGERFEFPEVVPATEQAAADHFEFAGLTALSQAMSDEDAGEENTAEINFDLGVGDTWEVQSFLVDGMPAGERQFLDKFLDQLEGDGEQ